MPSYGSQLYVNICPGVLDIVCSFIHPKFKDFLFRDWSLAGPSFSKEDVEHFMFNYRDLAIFRNYWNELDIIARHNTWNELIVRAVREDFFPLIDFLMTVRKETFKQSIHCYNFHSAKLLAKRMGKRKIEKYLDNYYKLDSNIDSSKIYKKNLQKYKITNRIFSHSRY